MSSRRRWDRWLSVNFVAIISRCESPVYFYFFVVLAWDPVSPGLSSLARKDKECPYYSASRDAGKILWDNTVRGADLEQADELTHMSVASVCLLQKQWELLAGGPRTHLPCSISPLCSQHTDPDPLDKAETRPASCTQHALRSVLTWVFFIVANIASRWSFFAALTFPYLL